MKIGDTVYLNSGACQGEAGTLCSFSPLSDPVPWAVVRLTDHPEGCRRVPLDNLAVMPDSQPVDELPREWAAGLV